MYIEYKDGEKHTGKIDKAELSEDITTFPSCGQLIVYQVGPFLIGIIGLRSPIEIGIVIKAIFQCRHRVGHTCSRCTSITHLQSMTDIHHQFRHSFLGLLGRAGIVFVSHLFPLQSGARQIIQCAGIATPIVGIRRNDGSRVLRPFPEVHDLSHSRCHTTRSAMRIGHAIFVDIRRSVEVVRIALVPFAGNHRTD